MLERTPTLSLSLSINLSLSLSLIPNRQFAFGHRKFSDHTGAVVLSNFHPMLSHPLRTVFRKLGHQFAVVLMRMRIGEQTRFQAKGDSRTHFAFMHA